MEIETMSESRLEARRKWREYNDATKRSKDPIYKDLKNVYNQVKNGRKIIDIFKVIQKGGRHDNMHPKLAIAQASQKNVWCRYDASGTIVFKTSDSSIWGRPMKQDIELEECLPTFDPKVYGPIMTDWNGQKRRDLYFHLQAPIPLIPPKILPSPLTEDYFILWEVDEWKQVPPTDPWLLKRITKTLFVVLAGWDLTELEKSVMHGKMI